MKLSGWASMEPSIPSSSQMRAHSSNVLPFCVTFAFMHASICATHDSSPNQHPPATLTCHAPRNPTESTRQRYAEVSSSRQFDHADDASNEQPLTRLLRMKSATPSAFSFSISMVGFDSTYSQARRRVMYGCCHEPKTLVRFLSLY